MVNYVCSEEGVYCEGLVILPLKPVNVSRSCGHSLDEGALITQVFPRQPHEVMCAVKELLHGGNHVDLLVYKISCLFLGEEIR